MTETLWQRHDSPDSTEKRHVLLGVTGSIAAYKSAELARLLVSWGYEVRVIMTQSAQRFITPVTMSTISGRPVTTDFWDENEIGGVGHIQLADWADVLVVAPATADFMAKLAFGFADTPLLAIALATKAPLLLAPAMNVNMYQHPKTVANKQELLNRGVSFVEPEEGMLACGWKGRGRLAHPSEIFYHVRRILSSGDFRGRRLLITTGPTREPIDPVRFISNRSSGKMGVALAREAFRRGAEVTLVHGPCPIRVPLPVHCLEVGTAQEMRDLVFKLVYGDGWDSTAGEHKKPDAVIMAAAVADYRPAEAAEQKIKKSAMPGGLKLVKNPDILHELGERRGSDAHPLLVGFAVETGEIDDLLAEARNKLHAKNADLIVGNFAQDALELDTNRAWLVDRHGKQEEIATGYKSRVANKILDAVLRLW